MLNTWGFPIFDSALTAKFEFPLAFVQNYLRLLCGASQKPIRTSTLRRAVRLSCIQRMIRQSPNDPAAIVLETGPLIKIVRALGEKYYRVFMDAHPEDRPIISFLVCLEPIRHSKTGTTMISTSKDGSSIGQSCRWEADQSSLPAHLIFKWGPLCLMSFLHLCLETSRTQESGLLHHSVFHCFDSFKSRGNKITQHCDA